MPRYRAHSDQRNIRGYEKQQREVRGNALIGAFGGFLAAYLLAELFLASQPHTWHWFAAGVGAVAGYWIAYYVLMRRLNAPLTPPPKRPRR